MLHVLLLLASLANAQETSISTGATVIPLITEIEISNLGKDTRLILQGRPRFPQPHTFAKGICFGDGTCQTTAPVSTASVYIATGVINIPQTTGTNTTFAGCNIAGSTVQATVSLSTYVAHVEAQISSSQNGETIGLIALMNGQQAAKMSAGQSACITQSFFVNQIHHISCDFIFYSTSTAGSSFCLGARDGTSGGTWTFYQGATGDAIHGNSFMVRRWGP